MPTSTARRVPHQWRIRIAVTARTSARRRAARPAPTMSSTRSCAHRVSMAHRVAPPPRMRYLRAMDIPLAVNEPARVDEADVERLAAHIGLTIPPGSRAAVAQHLAALLAAVRVVEEFPLPETTEPAWRFEP